MGVESDSVDINVQRPLPGVEEFEYQVSRDFSYLVRIVRNVRDLTDIYAKIRKQKDWGLDSRIANLNSSFAKWLEDLPSDLQIHYPLDGSPPWLPSHFVGNMHSYYHLSVIMLHRPQIMTSSSFTAGGSWKQHMSVCYNSAKMLCRLQEATLRTFCLNGLLCMQRGLRPRLLCSS